MDVFERREDAVPRMNAPDQTTTQSPMHTPVPPAPIPRKRIPGSAYIVLYLLLALATVTIGIGAGALRSDAKWMLYTAEALSIAAVVLMILHMWRAGRAAKGLYPVLITGTVFLAYLTQSCIIPAMVIALLFLVGEGSALVAVVTHEQARWLPLLPILGFAATVAVCRDPLIALITLVPFPAMLTLAFGTRKSNASDTGITRVGVICATAFALGLSITAVAAAFFYRRFGSISPSVLNTALETLRAYLIQAFTAVELPPEATDEMRELFTLENATNMVNSAINILPGTLISSIAILCAAAQMIQHATLQTFAPGTPISDRARVFAVSLVAGIVFAIAYLVAIFSSDGDSTLIGTVAQNIYLVLLPGLALAGLIRVMSSLTRRGAGSMGCMFFLVILIPCLFLLAPVALALVEVVGGISSAIASRVRRPHDQDPFGPSSDD